MFCSKCLADVHADDALDHVSGHLEKKLDEMEHRMTTAIGDVQQQLDAAGLQLDSFGNQLTDLGVTVGADAAAIQAQIAAGSTLDLTGLNNGLATLAGGIAAMQTAAAAIAAIANPPQPATSAVIVINQGANVSGNINVDFTPGEETASVEWLDDKGDTNAVAPAGAVVAFTSDNPAVVTIDPTSGAVTVVGEGTANIGLAPLTDASGNPLLEPDGVTPFAQPTPVAVTVGPGPADALVLSLSV